MKQRCANPKATKYEIYGGKGVRVCDEWQEYEPFHKWAMANEYKNSLTIDRIDNNGDYCPENCRWATYRKQNLNKSQNRLVAFKGKTMPLAEWAERLGMNYSTLRARLSQYGWPVEKALTKPVRERRSDHEAAKVKVV